MQNYVKTSGPSVSIVPDRVSIFTRITRVAQSLSIDVALGAVFSSAMFCRLMGVVPLPWAQLLVLGGTVLLIYTVDHQADVHNMPHLPVTERHRFHWQYRSILRPFSLVLTLLLAVSAFVVLNRIVWVYGLWLAGAVGAYLLVVSQLPEDKAHKWFHKEILIAVLYTAGVWGSVAIQASPLRPFARLAGIVFGLLALQNLMIFSYFEWEEDTSQRQRSLARAWGKRNVRTGLLLLSVVVLGLLLFGGQYIHSIDEWAVYVTLWLMAAVLTILAIFPDFFRINHWYRWLGDGVFLFTIWSLFI